MRQAFMDKEQEISTTRGLRLDGILRRYIDLPKLLDLLHSHHMYLRRADGFSDRLEGALFPSLRDSLNKTHAQGQSEYDAEQFYLRARKGSYVSCWTMSATDSMALWQLYGGVRNSVAITTTVRRLMNTAFPWGNGIQLYKVKYVNHIKVNTYVIWKLSDVLQYKHKAYQHEKELRLVVPRQEDNWDENPMGLRLPITNINNLIRSVVVAPEADDDFYKAVKDLCSRFELRSPVRRSQLSFVPT